jgi:glycosyltransferase involved in cell wall biosynthesis
VRVAFLTNFIPPYRIRLYEALTREAGEMRIFISTAMESNRHWQPEWGTLDVVQQRALTLRRTWRTRSFTEPYELHIPYDTILQLRKWRPDVILTGEMGARSLQAVAYARATKTPVAIWAMLSERTEEERSVPRAAARRWLMTRADAIIVNGESGARYFRRHGVNDDRLLRINQSLDMTPFLALPLERPAQRGLHLLHVGTLSERKGVRVLLQALSQRDGQPGTITFVGDGPLAAELQAMAVPSNFTVNWIGNVPYAELPKWYGQADVLLFPSLGDEWGLVVNEALAAGVPVMGSVHAQAVTELVQDGVNGWVFNPDTPESTRAALGRVLATPAQDLERMRRAARESIRNTTPERAAARIVERLRALASGVHSLAERMH